MGGDDHFSEGGLSLLSPLPQPGSIPRDFFWRWVKSWMAFRAVAVMRFSRNPGMECAPPCPEPPPASVSGHDEIHIHIRPESSS